MMDLEYLDSDDHISSLSDGTTLANQTGELPTVMASMKQHLPQSADDDDAVSAGKDALGTHSPLLASLREGGEEPEAKPSDSPAEDGPACNSDFVKSKVADSLGNCECA